MSNGGDSFPNVNTHTSCHNSCSAETIAWLNDAAERRRRVPAVDVDSLTSVKHI